MIVAAFLLASWLGCCITATPWSDRMGRRFWMLLGAVTQIVGTVICASSYSSGQLIAGRVIIVSYGPIYLHLLARFNMGVGYRKRSCGLNGTSIRCRDHTCHNCARTTSGISHGICLHWYGVGILDVRNPPEIYMTLFNIRIQRFRLHTRFRSSCLAPAHCHSDRLLCIGSHPSVPKCW